LPACGRRWRKDAATITDRALRYRANACPPPGPRICCLCGSTRSVEIGHLNGREEDTSPQNLIFTCRADNVRCGNALRAARLGRLTRQYNPSANADAPEPDEWLIERARATAGGARIHATEQLIGAYRMYAAVLKRQPGDRRIREQFYATEAKLRAGLRGSYRQINPSDGARSMGQWVSAVQAIKGQSTGMSIQSAVEMIRATPPKRRSEYALEIWRRRRERYGPAGRFPEDEPPF